MRHLVDAGGAGGPDRDRQRGDGRLARRRAARSAQPRGRRGARHPAVGDGAPVHGARLRPLRSRHRDGSVEPRRAAAHGARRPPIAARCGCCDRSTRARRPTPTCPTPTTAGRAASTRCSTSASAPAGACSPTCGERTAPDMDARAASGAGGRAGVSAVVGGAAAGGRRHQPGVRGRRWQDGRRLFVKSNAALAAATCSSAEARGPGLAGRGQGAARARRCVARVGGERRDAVPGAGADQAGAARARTSTSGWGGGWRRCTGTARGAFGLDHDNFVGRLPQKNTLRRRRWPEFYRVRRLEPQLRAGGRRRAGVARACGAGSSGCSRSSTTLCGPPEPPAAPARRSVGRQPDRATTAGEPCLIDPAVYGGHREIDLAMMRLFGGFGPRVFAAYDEAWPLADGHARAGAAVPALPADGSRQPVRRRLRRLGRGRARADLT